MSGKAGTVLLVDDDPAVRMSLEAALDDDFTVVAVANAKAAHLACDQHDVDVLITDFEMPEVSGVQLLRKIAVSQPHVIGLLLTGHGTHREVRAADHDPSIYRVILKPCDPDDLIQTVRRAVSLSQLRRSTLKMSARKIRL